MSKKIVSCMCKNKLKIGEGTKKFKCLYCGREHEYVEPILENVELLSKD